MWGGILEVL
jgi:hypothetical protein